MFRMRPADLGVHNGRFAPCPPSPNCVSSQADPDDAEHHIQPIRGSIADVRRAVLSTPRTTIVTETPQYLHVEFRTRLLRFVDDVEFFFDGTAVQVRSCSRLGRNDFGVNRRRVEALRARVGGLP
jgi:uncharacterized protein (DUF1499 family)